MSDLIRSGKRFNIVVSILIAVLLWFYVVNVENPAGETMLSNVPVVIQGADVLEAKGLMVTDLDRATVDLKASGKRKTFLKLFQSNVSVNVDVSGIDQVGEHNLNGKVMPDFLRVDNTISLSEKDNFLITVTVKKKASKEIAVMGEFQGTLVNGYEADAVKVTPNSIEVSGPEDVIEQISHAVVILNGENIKESIQQELPFDFVDQEGAIIKEDSLRHRTKMISATLPVVKVYKIPLKVDIKSGGGANAEDANWTISPSTVKLSGPEDILQNLSDITLGEIDLTEVFDNKSESFQIPIPEGVENRSGVTEATVSVNIESLPMKSITANQISIINVPNGRKATLASDSLQVWVRGKQEQLDSVSEGNIRVVVDLEGTSYTRGQQRAAATVNLEGVSDVGVVGNDYSVSIILK